MISPPKLASATSYFISHLETKIFPGCVLLCSPHPQTITSSKLTELFESQKTEDAFRDLYWVLLSTIIKQLSSPEANSSAHPPARPMDHHGPDRLGAQGQWVVTVSPSCLAPRELFKTTAKSELIAQSSSVPKESKAWEHSPSQSVQSESKRSSMEVERGGGVRRPLKRLAGICRTRREKQNLP